MSWDNVVDQVVEYVKQDLPEELSVSQLANMAYISSDHLTHSFKNDIQTASDFILCKYMTLAGDLLRDSKLTITIYGTV